MRKLKNSELERKSVEKFKSSKKNRCVIILDNVRSALNVGSIFRTADSFLIEKIYLCGITAKPPNSKIHKSALGSTESVEWEYIKSTESIIVELRSKGYRITSIEQAQGSISLQDYTLLRDPIALVFGHEVYGVSELVMKMCDDCIEIPQYGTKHSLNIAVSTGIVLWSLFGNINK